MLIGILVADAGCILQSLTDYLSPHNHIVPLDLGAKGRYVKLYNGLRSPPSNIAVIAVKSVGMWPQTPVAYGC